MRTVLGLVLAFVAVAYAQPNVPTVPIYNTAQPGLVMPALGLGTGGYNSDSTVGYNGYPECWDQDSGCSEYVERAVTSWLSIGGLRLDLANSYHNDAVVGKVLAATGVNRSSLFILEKIGPSLPLGYDDAHKQFAQILSDLGTDYVDMLLIHWPVQNPSQGNVSHNNTISSDPACQMGYPTYNETLCRLDTWRAMVEIYNSGAAKAVGVSNYNQTHIQEIIDAGMPLPALNQCPFHLYHSTVQAELVDFCRKHNITFLGYSPLGVPDWHNFTSPLSRTELEDPLVVSLAAKYDATPAQILLAMQWQVGVPVNPRSMDPVHMKLNIDAYGYHLEASDLEALLMSPQDLCVLDEWYECHNKTQAGAKSLLKK